MVTAAVNAASWMTEQELACGTQERADGHDAALRRLLEDVGQELHSATTLQLKAIASERPRISR